MWTKTSISYSLWEPGSKMIPTHPLVFTPLRSPLPVPVGLCDQAQGCTSLPRSCERLCSFCLAAVSSHLSLGVNPAPIWGRGSRGKELRPLAHGHVRGLEVDPPAPVKPLSDRSAGGQLECHLLRDPRPEPSREAPPRLLTFRNSVR